MQYLPEPEPFSQDDLLTPCHAIEFDIQNSCAVASKGKFSDENNPNSQKTVKKISKIPTITQNRPNTLSGSPSKSLVSAYTLEKNKRQAESIKSEVKLTDSENLELFSRLDKECEMRKERMKTGKGSNSPDRSSNVSISVRNSPPLSSPGKSILKYPVKRKFKEEVQAPEIYSSISRLSSEQSSFSTPSKSISFLLSPPKRPFSANKKSSKPFSTNKTASKPAYPKLSNNSPLKVIQKIQNLVKKD